MPPRVYQGWVKGIGYWLLGLLCAAVVFNIVAEHPDAVSNVPLIAARFFAALSSWVLAVASATSVEVWLGLAIVYLLARIKQDMGVLVSYARGLERRPER